MRILVVELCLARPIAQACRPRRREYATSARRHGLSPAPKRNQAISWKDFIRSHMEVLVGADFFTVEVLTLKGLVTYYVLFFIHLEGTPKSGSKTPAL
jgi:hypothetical protein